MEDSISQLPDDLLKLILLNVSTRDSVKTSVLSSRWRNLWKGVPGLHLIGDAYKEWEFIDRFLNLHEEAPIYRFTLMCYKNCDDRDGFFLKWLIDKLITRGVECFAISGSMYPDMMNLPVSLYKCETLIHLVLCSVELDDCEFFYLPCLETMHLENLRFSSEEDLEMLILCSPVLQALSIVRTTLEFVTLQSETVKRLSLRSCFSSSSDDGVVIDTPSLEFLSIQHVPLKYIRLESVSSSIKMCINTGAIAKDDMWRMDAFSDFFAGISGVTDLILSSHTIHRIFPYYLQPLQLPNFDNLTYLKAYFGSGYSEVLPTFLSSCPNLKSLDLRFDDYPNTKKIASSLVPQCFQTLENVEVQMMMLEGQQRSREAEIKFAKYILENARILKKLTLWLYGEEESSSILERSLMFPNHSFVEVKMNQRPAKFQIGYGFEVKSHSLIRSPCFG